MTHRGIGRVRRLVWLTPVLAGLVGCGSEASGDKADAGVTSSAIHLNPGSTGSVGTEAPTTSGNYPAVLTISTTVPDSNGLNHACTATVVAPYTLLTAGHCNVNTSSSSGWAGLWRDSQGNNTVSLPSFSGVWTNPYFADTSYQPSWWQPLARQIASAGNDYSPYDNQVIFVPSLTPSFLENNGITPIPIGQPPGSSGSFQYQAVGTASSAPSFNKRSWVASQYLSVPSANLNQATNSPPDAFFSLDTSTANYGSTDPGDSGGPVVAFQLASTAPGQTMPINRYVASVSSTTSGWEAGLTQSANVSLSSNQQWAGKNNALWAEAAVDDVDGDGLPTLCDPDPTTYTSTSLAASLCGPEVGAPSGASLSGTQSGNTTALPVADLACAAGYVAVGLSGRVGALIDDLSVQCEPIDCFGAKSCASSYWTADFIGPGGGSFSESCPSGDVMVGVQGQQNPGSTITSIQGVCAPWSSLGNTSSNVGMTGGAVGGAGSASYSSLCPGNRALVGFQARSWNRVSPVVVTGLQPICADVVDQMGLWVGGTGGGASDLACPPGMIANGITWSTQTGSGQIGALGTICWPSQSVASANGSNYLANQTTWITHGTAYDPSTNYNVPALVEPYATAHVAQSMNYTYCPGGYVLSGLQASYSTSATASGQIAGISMMTCSQLGNPSAITGVTVNAGQYNSGTTYVMGCPTSSEVADGMFVHSGWITDAAALHCTSNVSAGIFNGGFELGTLAGWTASGASEQVSSTSPFAGTYDAELGLPTATNGDSTIVQNFVAPPGTSFLTVDYKMTCPDSVTFDWVTVTLTDTSDAVTYTMVPKTCATDSGYVSVGQAVVAGHSYTLTLTSHDDDYFYDPSYTLFDGITIQ
jgi:hypothetical protein